jgi:copper chaperone NosL
MVALIGRRAPLYGWFAGFFLASAGGLVDFWRWEYDYGHNIDFEHAIIKIPGMNYQPPLMGVKQLLNFTAVSWPDAGGWLAFIAFALATLAVVTVFRSTASEHASA